MNIVWESKLRSLDAVCVLEMTYFIIHLVFVLCFLGEFYHFCFPFCGLAVSLDALSIVKGDGG